MNFNYFQEILFISATCLVIVLIFSGFFVALSKISLGINTILVSIMLFSVIFALAYSSNVIDKNFQVSLVTQKLSEGMINFSQKIMFVLTSLASIILCFEFGWFFRQNQNNKQFKQKHLSQKTLLFLKKYYYTPLGILLMFASYTLVFILTNFLNSL
jgi:hypothetical protein